eukprot:TRINITY_DN7294_c0_g1_i1.p2 TRINITY_DN7294_c0_g1~~TRINITY_DN7294_c0_g1_i1.p2  ORF type:complete len:60 (+),score=8.17 TRINITY_DN7294_c0_g1_i1:82-261(+)
MSLPENLITCLSSRPLHSSFSFELIGRNLVITRILQSPILRYQMIEKRVIRRSAVNAQH